MRNYKNIKGNKIEKTIIDYISEHDYHKNCYFWSPPGSASQRRSKEWDRELKFKYKGQDVEVSQSVSYSCSNVYYSFCVYVDSLRKNITFLKKLVK